MIIGLACMVCRAGSMELYGVHLFCLPASAAACGRFAAVGPTDANLCGKICDMCTLLKYAKNEAIAYSHKTDMPRQWHVPVLDWLKAEVQE